MLLARALPAGLVRNARLYQDSKELSKVWECIHPYPVRKTTTPRVCCKICSQAAGYFSRPVTRAALRQLLHPCPPCGLHGCFHVVLCASCSPDIPAIWADISANDTAQPTNHNPRCVTWSVGYLIDGVVCA